jgi:hypothetical protein
VAAFAVTFFFSMLQVKCGFPLVINMWGQIQKTRLQLRNRVAILLEAAD